MPVYVLFRGDCSNLAYQQTGKSPFVATDAAGRQWLCVETDMPEIGGDFPAAAVEMMQAQRKAYEQGLNREGSEVRLMDCPDDATLRRRLIEDAGPSVKDYRARLLWAGWIFKECTFGTGKPFRLTLTSGDETFTVEGAGELEAWAAAAREKITMDLTIRESPLPLRKDTDGAVRVGASRVSLDVVIREYLNGASPEAIAHNYPTLRLADVYTVIAYYLRNQGEVHSYLMAIAVEAEQLRREIEAAQPGQAELKAELLTRKARREPEHAAPGK